MFFTRYIFCLLAVFSILQKSESQTPLAIGEWGDALPFMRGNSFTQSDDFLFIGCPGGILRLSKADSSFTTITKADGLTDYEPRFVAYDSLRNELMVVYSSSNIDLITADDILNFSDILDNGNILTEKVVNDLFLSSSSAYIALDFGLVEFDLDRRLFGSTVFTNSPVLCVLEQENTLWIGLEDGIYRISKDRNVSDFSLWEKQSIDIANFDDQPCTQLVEWNGQIAALVNGKILLHSDDKWAQSDILTTLTLRNIRAEGDLLWTIQDCFSCTNSIRRYSPEGEERIYDMSCARFPFDVLDLSGSEQSWFLENNEFFHFNDASGRCREFRLNRPETNDVYSINARNGDLVLATGGVNSNFGNLFKSSGIYHRLDETWETLSPRNNAKLNEADLRDVLSVVYHEQRDAYYFGSYWSGVVEWSLENDSIAIYDWRNSALSKSIQDDQTRISDLALDGDGNLWIANYEAELPLSVYTADGLWFSFSIPYNIRPSILEVSPEGLVYVGLRNFGVAVLNPRTIANPNDDLWTLLPISETGIPNDDILELALDQEGNVWVGTSEGASLINCTSDLDCIVNRPIIEPSYLLQSERVMAIAVDGGNRKWFGTENGVYLLSADNREELAQFTAENAPLTSNNIIDIEIDPTTGYVYFATPQGLNILRAEATQGLRFHGSEAIVFPNPVRPDYFGPITIKNLTENAFVKIMTIQGRLVYEGRSIGGQFVWDGRDQDGQRVSSGVYLAYALNDRSLKGTDDGLVAKIMMIR